MPFKIFKSKNTGEKTSISIINAGISAPAFETDLKRSPKTRQNPVDAIIKSIIDTSSLKNPTEICERCKAANTDKADKDIPARH